MTQASGDMTRFQAALDSHGGVLSRWPAALRESAIALLAESSEARAALSAQQHVEALLDTDAVPLPAASLRDSILARAPRARADWRDGIAELWAALGGLRIAGPAFAAALVLGVSLGSTFVTAEDDVGDDSDLVALAQLADEYPEY